MKNKVVRISIGRFDHEKLESVKRALAATQEKLTPGIKSMKGNIGNFAGIDYENSAMVNVSLWDSLSSAKQMDSFQPMLDLAKEFVVMGVRFERPILNFESLWTIEQPVE